MSVKETIGIPVALLPNANFPEGDPLREAIISENKTNGYFAVNLPVGSKKFESRSDAESFLSGMGYEETKRFEVFRRRVIDATEIAESVDALFRAIVGTTELLDKGGLKSVADAEKHKEFLLGVIRKTRADVARIRFAGKRLEAMSDAEKIEEAARRV